MSTLIARLRLGSVLTTRTGASYRVIEPVLQVAPNGGVVPTVLLEKSAPAGSPQTVLMPVGMLTNLMRRGGRHKPGHGATIDWSQVQRRMMARETTVLRGRGDRRAGAPRRSPSS